MAFMAAAAPLMAAASPYIGAASVGMSILGGINQSNAQRQAGDAAYQQALAAAQVRNQEAAQLDQNAGQQEAASQRTAIDARRKGMLMASRLRAVMGASGGGIDNNLLASLEGQGEYNADTALYDGSEKARGMRNQAAMDRWSGGAGVAQGAYTRSSMDGAADATLVGSIGRGALSFAQMYGGPAPGGDYKTLSPTDTMTAYKNAPGSFRIPGFDGSVDNPLA